MHRSGRTGRAGRGGASAEAGCQCHNRELLLASRRSVPKSSLLLGCLLTSFAQPSARQSRNTSFELCAIS